MISDLLLYETGNGGDLLVRGGDMVAVTGYENAVYLAMFGGSNYMGNYMLAPENQFKSKTEAALRNVALTSAGRIKIANAVNEDLAFLKNIPGTKYSVNVNIGGPNKVEILIDINGKEFLYVWQPDKLFLTYSAPMNA